MEIRPHHALCAQFFEGKGYSEPFAEHMRRVLTALKNTDAVVTLTGGCDCICAGCPNHNNGVCTSDDKVKEIDARAADKMGLTAGDTVRWSRLCELAEQTVIRPGLLREVCGDCEWIGLCAGKARKNNGEQTGNEV